MTAHDKAIEAAQRAYDSEEQWATGDPSVSMRRAIATFLREVQPSDAAMRESNCYKPELKRAMRVTASELEGVT